MTPMERYEQARREELTRKSEILKYAAEVRKFEISNFWQRSLFFWGFIAAALIAYAKLYERDHESLLPFIVACFGFVASIAWTLQNRGGKYWQEVWEQKVNRIESEVLGIHLFSGYEPVLRKGFWGAQKFSVSRLAIALSDFTALIWIPLGAHALPDPTLECSNWRALGTLAVTGVYVALLFCWGRSELSNTDGAQ